MGGFAWVTLATNDSYSLGALVLAHSLRAVGTQQQLAVLVTPGVTAPMREKLSQVFNLVQEVNILDSKDEANLRLLQRPELGVTFTKLHCWRLTQYDKCVFLDADTLVLDNVDELFEREEFSAAPDVGWPDCFNSGVFVFKPSNETYDNLVKFALEKGSFDGGDQGLLNLYFSDWAHKDISKHLPFIYNMCSTACYSYLPAFKQFGSNVKIVHFIGATKPWLQYFDTESRQVRPAGGMQHLQVVLQRWWDIFCTMIHPVLTPEMAGLAGAFAQFTLGSPRTGEQDALEDHLRRQGWEVGNIDYMGADSFDNIWSKICKTMAAAPAQPSKSREPSPTRDSPSEQTTEVKGKTRKSPQKESDPKLETKAEPVLPSETPESDPKKSGEVPSHESAPSSHEEAPKACPNQIHSLTQETHKSDVQVCDKPAQSSAPLKEDLSACQSPPQPAAASTNEGTQEASPSEQTKPSEPPQTVDSERIQDPIPSEQNIPLEPAQPIDPIPADQKKLSESAQTVDSEDKQVSIQSEQKKPSEPAQTVDSEKSQAPIPAEQDKSSEPAQTVDSGSSQAPIPSEQIKSSEPAQSVDSEKSQAPISSEQNKSSEPAQTVDSASSQAPIPSEQDKSSEPAQTVDSGSTQAPIPSEQIKSSEPAQTVDSEKSQAPIPSEQDKSSKPVEAVESESTQKKPSEPAQTAKSEESQDPIPSEQNKPSEPAQTVDSKGSDTPLPTPKTRSKNKNGQKVSTPSSPSVTEATPPTSPSASALPTNVEPSLGVETDVPATPPPKETAAASPPTPPPRKGSGAKKPGSAKK